MSSVFWRGSRFDDPPPVLVRHELGVSSAGIPRGATSRPATGLAPYAQREGQTVLVATIGTAGAALAGSGADRITPARTSPAPPSFSVPCRPGRRSWTTMLSAVPRFHVALVPVSTPSAVSTR